MKILILSLEKPNYYVLKWLQIKEPEIRLILLIKSAIRISKKSYLLYKKHFENINKNIIKVKKTRREIKYEITKNNFICFTYNKKKY